MSLNIGNGLLSAHISGERLHAIANNSTPPEMSLWEKIKEFFFSTHQKEALECIYKLYHHANIQISAEEVHGAFIRLCELASPGCKEQFSYSYVCDPCGGMQYTIIGKSGETLLSVTIHAEENEQRADAPLTPSQYCRVDPPTYLLFHLAEAIQKLYRTEMQCDLSHIDRIIVFGDSLSDSEQRAFKKTHHILPSYHQYYEGRFTNGFTWSEYLSSPAFLKKPIINFAEGGSTSASYSLFNLCGDFLSNLDTQIKSYQPSPKDLSIFFIGANDYMTLHKDNILKVVEKQIDDVTKLLKAGLKNILIMGIPDLSTTPYGQRSSHIRKFKDITLAHNSLLKKNIEILNEQNDDEKIFFFDTASAFENIKNVARQLNYDTTHAYTKHGYVHIPGEKDPDLNISPQYLFNDDVHPTQEVHHAFASLLSHFIVHNY
ncbi:SGNH/GDSL hydrolase family protein [Lonsdalea quercina]|uniref:SGNH/GDSL hydrolase family protein n=1 Tax=Lonsdalea quercina TaxID=71657 RepID=UPI0039756D23